ncbi:unnamed protein product [Choristocarpus tenellus]
MLQELGINRVLNVTPPKTMDPANGVPNFFEKDRTMTYKRVPIFDNRGEDLLQHFEACISFIEQGKFYGSVLVHCHKGVSRSATVICAYLMRTRGLGTEKAMTYLRTRRSMVNPHEGFLEQLNLFQKKNEEERAQEDKDGTAEEYPDDLLSDKPVVRGGLIGPSRGPGPKPSPVAAHPRGAKKGPAKPQVGPTRAPPSLVIGPATKPILPAVQAEVIDPQQGPVPYVLKAATIGPSRGPILPAVVQGASSVGARAAAMDGGGGGREGGKGEAGPIEASGTRVGRGDEEGDKEGSMVSLIGPVMGPSIKGLLANRPIATGPLSKEDGVEVTREGDPQGGEGLIGPVLPGPNQRGLNDGPPSLAHLSRTVGGSGKALSNDAPLSSLVGAKRDREGCTDGAGDWSRSDPAEGAQSKKHLST